MRHILILWIIFSCFITPKKILAVGSDNLEIFMRTMNTNGATVRFTVSKSTDKPIWNPDNNLIDTESFSNPASLTIIGDYSGDSKGWHTDEGLLTYQGRPCLQWSYNYIIRVAGKTTKLSVETLGWFGWDKNLMYNYKNAKYYLYSRSTRDTVGGPIATLNMRDNTAYLQPTQPSSFSCINPTGYGQNPQFDWEAPEHPTNTTFSYEIYRNTGSGYSQIGSTSSTSFTDTGAELDKFGNTTY